MARDKTKPTVRITDPLQDDTYVDLPQLTIHGYARDNNQVAWVKIKIVDADTMAVVQNYIDANDITESLSPAWSTWYLDFLFPYAGNYLIKAKAQDLTGNFSHHDVVIHMQF